MLLLLAAGARAAYLGGIRGSDLKQAAATQQKSEVEVPAARGAITDSKGVQLAVSERAYDIAATPYLIKDPAGVAAKLSKHLDVDSGELIKKLTDQSTGFVYLGRKVPDSQAEKVRDLAVEGIELIPTSRRVYPRRWLAAQLVGTVGVDGDGLIGLEQSKNTVLAGSDGKRTVVRDALGRPISLRDSKKSRPGTDIQLTIDAAVQEQTEEVLSEVGEKYSPKGATAIVMDPRTSELLAVADWPRVDASDLGGAPSYARQERATASNYEPGSTFKAFTVSSALEEGVVQPDTSFNLPPTIVIADREIGESHDAGYRTLTTKQIIAQSSNVGSIMIGQRVGKERFSGWIKKFGFGQPTGVDIPGEASGIVPQLKDYTAPTLATLSIGHGIAVTPMQIVSGYAAIANGGTLRRPKIFRRIGSRKLPADIGKSVISAETAKEVRKMLEGVLEEGGTASKINVPGYTLAGKTGTANKLDPNTGEYSKSKYYASFVGFAPASSPELLIAVVVDEPQGAIYGGEVAAPAFQKIATFALPYLQVSTK